MAQDTDTVREEMPSRADLMAAWTRDHGRSPPRGISTRLLRLSAAYYRQAAVHGGLNRATRRRLAEIAGGSGKVSAPYTAPAGAAAPRPGTRLVREWQGKPHVVDVHEDHVVYDGMTYRSLSAVARAITGARWSGPRFFGVGGR